MTKIGIIVDQDLRIHNWQFKALLEIPEVMQSIAYVFVCNNQTRIKFSFRNILYFLLITVSRIRICEYKKTRIDKLNLPSAQFFSFSHTKVGNWEIIPPEMHDYFRSCEVIIKFGMNLLKIEDTWEPKQGVISFHHGDPRKYRGRPPAFYEVLNKEDMAGVIVQRLSNTLDGGKVLAFAETRVLLHSYRKTLRNLYVSGIPLLKKALEQDSELEKFFPSTKLGKVYRYPSNFVTIQFLLKGMKYFFIRIYYGAFIEKVWSIAVSNSEFGFESSEFVINDFQLIKKSNSLHSVADPVGTSKCGLYVEGISKLNVGRIYLWDGETYVDVNLPRIGHFSYPFLVKLLENNYLLPEVASHSSPRLYKLGKDGKWEGTEIVLGGLESTRLIDPTLFKHEGYFYLFAGHEQANERLELYFSENVQGPYSSHPCSPISMTPKGSRMAGPVELHNGKIFRFGQDCSHGYGKGVLISQILELSPARYREVQVGEVSVNGLQGPHAVHLSQQKYYFDCYTENFSIVAGLRRLVSQVLSS